MACAVLHNVCLHYNIPDAEPLWDDIDRDYVDQIFVDQGELQYRNLGQLNQTNYINTYF